MARQIGFGAYRALMQLATRSLAPLYLAGFTTAVGALGVASALGSQSDDIGMSLISFGLVLALYDIAEVILKPIFGTLTDRIGPKPVIIGGLAAFALVSLLVLVWQTPLSLAVARLGQGAAASAFSPASSAAVARLAGKAQLGRYFGRYGGWKSLGYVVGPMLGVALVQVWDIRAIYAALALLAAVAALWTLVAMPTIPVMRRPRYTLADLLGQIAERGFVVPTLLLATTTAILGVSVGFLPLLASRLDLDPLVGAGAVASLALISALVQPRAGRLLDQRRVTAGTVGFAGLATAAGALVLLALAPNAVTMCVAAATIGAAIGTVTPVAFAQLAAATPEERMGRTMGNADLGRELGDAGGPLLVGAVASLTSLPVGLGALALITLAAGVFTSRSQSAAS